MEEIKMIGKVKWYKTGKSYGYIIGADEELYFFQISNCVNQSEIFNTGDKVMFIPNWEEFDYATKVEKVM